MVTSNMKITTAFQVLFYFWSLRFPKIKVGVALPLAQAVHETANWTSSLWLNHKNAFGMKQPVKRKTSSNGPTATGFASFGSLYDAIHDYFLRLENFGILDDAALIANLKSPSSKGGYAEDGIYYKKLTKHVVALQPVLIEPLNLIKYGALTAALAVGVVVASSSNERR
jgi:hypothetical protein